ncbi:cytosine-specific methyltransferase [Haematococcus lacustris]|uniref:Cytosine-specific methyltransferase n=1 Tax=Haematococcus lacustris TaxID=44745 RepID=A0A699YE51_HAELA|nr:cytosine-specific methyltransferase [Haematococcus lacustris]
MLSSTGPASIPPCYRYHVNCVNELRAREGAYGHKGRPFPYNFSSSTVSYETQPAVSLAQPRPQVSPHQNAQLVKLLICKVTGFVFAAPVSGEEFTDWKEAADVLKQCDNVQPAAPPSQAVSGSGKENGAVKAEGKCKTAVKRARPAEASDVPTPAEPATTTPTEGDDLPTTDGSAANKRRAAQNKNYKESGNARSCKSDMVEVKEDVVCASEADALAETGGKASIKRRLVDLCLVDSDGQPTPVERSLLLPSPVNLTGVVHAPEGEMAKGKGRRVAQAFGPLKEWKLVYSKASVQVVLRTAAAVYEVIKPAPSYRKIWSQFEELVELAHQVSGSLNWNVWRSRTVRPGARHTLRR